MSLRDIFDWLRWPLVLAVLAGAAWALGGSAWGWLLGSLAVAAFFIASPGLRIAIWYSRVPTAFALAGVLALTVPEQVRYLIASTQTLPQIVALPLAVFITGLGCWFWGRWSLNLAEVGGVIREPVPKLAWNWLPRVLAVAPAAAVLIAIIISSDVMERSETIVLWVLSFVVGAVLMLLAFWRRKLFDSLTRGVAPEDRKQLEKLFLHDFAVIHEFITAKKRRDGLATATDQFRPENWAQWFGLAIRCLPFHPRLLVVPVVLFLVAAVVTMSGQGPVVQVAQAIGAAPTALLGMACLLTLLAPVVGLVAARRWPALLLLLLWVVGATAANENNIVRTPAPAPKPRPTLEAAARAWLEECAEKGDDIRVVFVSAAGGASRAALWGGAVLDALERGKDGPGIDPAKHLFAVSGISGGALGMASYVALMDQAKAGCGGENAGKDPNIRLDQLGKGLSQDFLSPALAGLFFGDAFWRALGPFSAVLHLLGITPVERTYWLEAAWEAGVTLDNAGKPLTGTITSRTFPDDQSRPRLPLLFTGGTHQKTGQLVVTAPVVAAPSGNGTMPPISAVPGAMDATAAMASDPLFSVAASNSARFPVVTAPGLLRAWDPQNHKWVNAGHVVDGGYHDNLGTSAIMAAAEALIAAHKKVGAQGGKRPGSRLHLFVVQVWSDPDRVDLDPTQGKGPYTPIVPRCGVTRASADRTKPATPLDMVLSPLGALVAVRGERSNGGTRPIVETYCSYGWRDDGSRHFFAFTMGPDQGGVRPPLNWVQPARSQAAMLNRNLAGFPGLGNEEQLTRLRDEWQCATDRPTATCRASQTSGNAPADSPGR